MTGVLILVSALAGQLAYALGGPTSVMVVGAVLLLYTVVLGNEIPAAELHRWRRSQRP